jgi:flagellar FliL protein
MSDSLDDIEGGESPEASTSKKDKGGLKNLLPTILKFAAIGIGALIFIVTVAVITYNLMNKGGKSQTAVTDPLSPYIGNQPVYSWYTEIGQITTKTRDAATRDATNYMVTVDVKLAYDQTDATAATELSGRKIQLQAFMRRYFAGKYANELQVENEARLQLEIKEMLNTRFLSTARIREVEFTRFDVMETSN